MDANEEIKAGGRKHTHLSGSPTDRMLTARYFDENSETVRAPTTQPSLEFLGKTHSGGGTKPTPWNTERTNSRQYGDACERVSVCFQ